MTILHYNLLLYCSALFLSLSPLTILHNDQSWHDAKLDKLFRMSFESQIENLHINDTCCVHLQQQQEENLFAHFVFRITWHCIRFQTFWNIDWADLSTKWDTIDDILILCFANSNQSTSSVLLHCIQFM